ncbi:MAG: VanW family protein [Leptospira sp.]|nr:VanW family protein [Leptospira sp.]
MKAKNFLRKLIPFRIRLEWKLLSQWARDKRNGISERVVRINNPILNPDKFYEPYLTITQKMNSTPNASGKIHNLKHSTEFLKDIPIFPGQIFSFFALVGRPSKKTGFKSGRCLISGKLVTDYGGGICQLSGIIYQLAIYSGMKIHERHPHSFDIYTDETRFSPLGLDAGVAFGYKDLRFENTFAFPILFRFEFSETEISGSICSNAPIGKYEIELAKIDEDNSSVIRTIRNEMKTGKTEDLGTVRYAKYKE